MKSIQQRIGSAETVLRAMTDIDRRAEWRNLTERIVDEFRQELYGESGPTEARRTPEISDLCIIRVNNVGVAIGHNGMACWQPGESTTVIRVFPLGFLEANRIRNRSEWERKWGPAPEGPSID